MLTRVVAHSSSPVAGTELKITNPGGEESFWFMCLSLQSGQLTCGEVEHCQGCAVEESCSPSLQQRERRGQDSSIPFKVEPPKT